MRGRASGSSPDASQILANELLPDRVLLLVDRAEERLCSYLTMHGFVVRVAHNITDLDRLLQLMAHDFLLVDPGMAGREGVRICHRLRVQGHLVPIVLISAKSDRADRIMGLEMGADDVLERPVESRELIARLRSLRRRQRFTLAATMWLIPERHAFGSFSIDTATMELRRHGEKVPLSSTELQLLRIFLRHPCRPLGRDYLLDSLTEGRRRYRRPKHRCAIDVLVSRLRRRLGEDSTAPQFLRTIRGVGYMFLPDAQIDASSAAPAGGCG